MSETREDAACLQMFLQSAELRLMGAGARPELDISCELSNIARGSCSVRILPVDIAAKSRIGHVDIAPDRSLMRAELHLPRTSFDAFTRVLRHEPPRPIALVMALETALQTNAHGDLLSPRPTRVGVLDLSWNIPLI